MTQHPPVLPNERWGVPSPVRNLAAQLEPMRVEKSFWDDTEIFFTNGDDAGALGVEAVVGSGAGIDVWRGERVLAAALKRMAHSGHESRQVIAITDRKTVTSGWSAFDGGWNDTGFALAHADVTAVEYASGGRTVDEVVLHGPEGPRRLVARKLARQLAWFYRTLLDVCPPAARVEPETPFVFTSSDDPSGARHARTTLWLADTVAGQILDEVASRVASGSMSSEQGLALTQATVLAHRSTVAGPQRVDGCWVSALSAGELGDVLPRLLGAAPDADQVSVGNRYLDFPFDPRVDLLGASRLGLGMATFAAVGVGYDPAKAIGRAIGQALFGREQVRQLRVIILPDRSGCSLYRLEASGASLETKDSLLALRLHMALARVALPVIAATRLGPTGAPSGDLAHSLPGTYAVAGMNPESTRPYKGSLAVTARGEIYDLKWTTGNGEVAVGSGFLMGNILAASAGNAPCGVAAYLIGDGRLEGRWVVSGGRGGTETWKRRGPGLAGTYSVEGTYPDGGTYAGSVTVEPQGDMFRVEWHAGGEHRGFAVRRSNVFVVGFGGSGQFAAYTVTGDRLDGVWAGTTGGGSGTEVATR